MQDLTSILLENLVSKTRRGLEFKARTDIARISARRLNLATEMSLEIRTDVDIDLGGSEERAHPMRCMI